MRLQARQGRGWRVVGRGLGFGLIFTSTNYSRLSFYFIVRAKPVGSDIVWYIKSIIFLSINNCLHNILLKFV